MESTCVKTFKTFLYLKFTAVLFPIHSVCTFTSLVTTTRRTWLLLQPRWLWGRLWFIWHSKPRYAFSINRSYGIHIVNGSACTYTIVLLILHTIQVTAFWFEIWTCVHDLVGEVQGLVWSICVMHEGHNWIAVLKVQVQTELMGDCNWSVSLNSDNCRCGFVGIKIRVRWWIQSHQDECVKFITRWRRWRSFSQWSHVTHGAF